jgi:hypothetical protein
MNDRKKFSTGNAPNRDSDSRENDCGYDDKQLYGQNTNRERPAATGNNSRRYGRERGSDAERNRNQRRSISPPPHHASNRRNNQINSRRSRSNSEQGEMSFRESFHSGNRGGRGMNKDSRPPYNKYRDNDKNEPNKNHEFQKNNNNPPGISYSPPCYGDDKKSESFDENKRFDKFGGADSDSLGYNNKEGGDTNKLKTGDRVPEILDPEMREVFPFRIFIKDDYLKEGLASRNETDDIIRQSGIDSITMDNQI